MTKATIPPIINTAQLPATMPLNEAIAQKIELMTKRRGLRRSRPRETVIEAAFSATDHFTADELLQRVQKIDPQISRATVYRTLSLLEDEGLLREIDLGKDQRQYDPNFFENPSHAHLICVDCGQVEEFQDDHLDMLRDCISRRHGFTPTLHSMRIEACCEQLRREGTCPKLLDTRLRRRKTR